MWAVEQLGGARRAAAGTATTTINGVDAVVVPGGFAHGDYLRTGAIARFSPVMHAVGEFAAAGGPVVGICNGFQVLMRGRPAARRAAEERGPEVPVRDGGAAGRDHVDRAHERWRSVGDVLRIPINHFEGNYVCDERTLAELRAEDRVVVRYVDNPNGSLDDIAGICNAGRNVVGLMPHPERASDAMLGSADGVVLLKSRCSRPPRVAQRSRVTTYAFGDTSLAANGWRWSPTRSRRRLGRCCTIFPSTGIGTSSTWVAVPGSRRRCCEKRSRTASRRGSTRRRR